ncbi:hypothetical protein B1218_37885, partial [Pseudomonas ogarae]
MNPGPPNIRTRFVGGGEGAFIGHDHRPAAGLAGGLDLVRGAFRRPPHHTRLPRAALCPTPSPSDRARPHPPLL